MSWSLDIENGDIAVTHGKMAQVGAARKVEQDIGHWIMTKMGTDLMNNNYGSTINGGIRPDGTIVDSAIGGLFQTSGIEVELRRIVGEYQQQQLVRAGDDRANWNKTTLTADEIVVSLDDIDFEQDADKLTATLFITTASGAQSSVNIGFPSL